MTAKAKMACGKELGDPKSIRTILRKVDSGDIALEVGADGVYLQFDCDCSDALPYCHAACCCLPGIEVTPAETGKHRRIPLALLSFDDDGRATMARKASGWCRQNAHSTCLCDIYGRRPQTCQAFHCTRGPDMRGWLLGLNRQAEEEE